MKRFFAFAGLMTAAVISLTNCQPKELGVDTPAGKTVLIKASMDADTKTEASGMSTLWADGDKINLFYGSSSYTSLGEVTIADGVGTKQATFEVTGAPSGSQKWYAIYPYSSKLETPAAQTASFTYIGHSKGLTQDGFDNTAALCGSVCPLYGVAEGTAEEVNISMKHLASSIELNLTNNSGSDIIVNSVTVTASEDIVGSYYIAFDSGTPEYTPSGDNYVKSSAIVNMEDSTLGNGESGKVYLAVKPYTQSESVPFKVTVKATVGGEDKIAEIELNPKGNQCVFTAGKMKQVNVSIDSFGVDPGTSIADIHAGTATGSVTVKDVVVTSLFPKGYFVSDGSNILYVYQNGDLPADIAINKKVDVSGTVSTYKGNKQISSPTASVKGNGSVSLNPVSWKGSNVEAAFVDSNAAYVTLDMTTTSTTLAAVDGTETVLYFPAAQKAAGVTISKDKTYTVVGYIYGHATYSGSSQVYLYIETATEKITSETLTVSPTSVSLDQAGGSAEVTVTCDNSNWTITNEADWLTATKSGSTITFSASANEGTKRSTTVTINHSNGTLTATVKVTQEGAVESDAISLSPASLIFDAVPDGPQTVEVTSNTTGWTWDETTVADWITLSKSGSNISVTVAQNTGEARNCTVKVLHENGTPTANLVINQRAPQTGGTATFTKVTSSSVSTGDYLIVYDEGSKALDGSLTDFSKANFIAVTISGNNITANEGIAVHYDASAKRLQTASGYYLTGVAGKNNVTFVKEIPEGKESDYDITISYDSENSSYLIGCTLMVSSTATDYVLRFNTEYNYYRFYKTTSSVQTPVQLYKKQ